MTMERDPLDRLFDQAKCKDELLEVLFWLAGEGFEDEMTLEGVARFVARPVAEVRPALEAAVALGLVARTADTAVERYALTEAGRREGGRRFAVEFAPYVAREAHGGSCSDPNCDCRTSPEAAAACVSARR
jgi:hypothetical protein